MIMARLFLEWIAAPMTACFFPIFQAWGTKTKWTVVAFWESVMAASGSTSMNKTVKALAMLASAVVVLSFVVVIINQTAGVVQLPKRSIRPWGRAPSGYFLIAYGGLIGVPVVIVDAHAAPLVPP